MLYTTKVTATYCVPTTANDATATCSREIGRVIEALGPLPLYGPIEFAIRVRVPVAVEGHHDSRDQAFSEARATVADRLIEFPGVQFLVERV